MSFWNDMDLPECLVANTCPFKDGEGCRYTCYKYHAMFKLVAYSNLPSKLVKPEGLSPDSRNMEDFMWLQAFNENIVTHVEEGHGYFLHSPDKGNGKTTWTAKTLLAYFDQIAESFDMDRSRGLFVNVPDLIEKIKDGFDDDQIGKEAQLLKERIQRADIVVWDDIGAEMPTPYVKQLLYRFINHRYANNLSQLFTSNKNLDEITVAFDNDSRVSDRIYGQCKPIRIYGESKRGDQAWWNTK